MVPLRSVLEEHGVNFWWDGEGVSGTWPGHSIRVIPGREQAWRDGVQVVLDARVEAVNGAAFVPASFFRGLFEDPPVDRHPWVTALTAGGRVWYVGLIVGGSTLAPPVQDTREVTAWLLPSLDEPMVRALVAHMDSELQTATGGKMRLQPGVETVLRQAFVTGRERAALPARHLLGKSTIAFNPRGAYNNMRNAVRAAGHLNGSVISPGGVFSYNKAVGPRTVERGYLVGYAFEGKKHVPAVGGGVCRLSTVVYNAVLDAGLPVVERHQHSLPVGYVPLGKDATVSYGGADLKFRNSRPWPVLVEAGGSVWRLTVTLWELQH